MLHVGLVGVPHPQVSTVARHLVALGAVTARAEAGQLPAAGEAAVVLHGEGRRSEGGPCLQLLIGVTDPDAADGASDEDAGHQEVDVWLDGSMGPDQLGAAVEQLWHQRLVPFAANLRDGKRAPWARRPALAASDPTWPSQARRLIRRLDKSVGSRVLRIDHIGSTSVPGLPAKDLIDIQVTVEDLAIARACAAQVGLAGFVHVRGEWFGEDRFGIEHPEEVVVDADPGRPVNVNLRPVTAPVWRDALLFRDWLRTHPDERDAYAAMKRQLTDRSEAHVDDYGTAKMPWIRAALGRAEAWASGAEWGPSA